MLYLTGTATRGVGNERDNWLYGNDADNFLDGDGGNDFLDGGSGADRMYGVDGDDTFFVDNEGDQANETWDEGRDTVISTINWTLSSTDGLEDLILAWGSGAVTGIGNFLQNSITGNQNDNLLMGGDGDDSLNGGAGADTMWGGDGNDTFYFDDAGDRANEFAGQGLLDTVYSTVDTTVGLHIEYLRLVGGAIDGTGNSQANGIFGTESQNVLRGGGGNDALKGNGGNDFLYGEAGIDRLFGGMGADVMSGGSERDFFVFENIAETSYVLGGSTIYDRIVDFSSAQGDKIDLFTIDANGAGAGNGTFSFIGANAFHGVAGELRFADHFVEGDVDGNGFADFRIEVNVASLNAGDFLL